MIFNEAGSITLDTEMLVHSSDGFHCHGAQIILMTFGEVLKSWSFSLV